MEWESPWGIGFPGWHIECSAMSTKYLGPLFDIHCGGKDHIPVHHTNEIAQSEACYGTRLSNYWLHGYFLQTGSEKMAKSSGEFLRMQSLIDRGYDPIAFRFLCLSAHYRSDLNFSWDSLDVAVTALERLRAAFFACDEGGQPDADLVERFTACVNEDLNTSKALAVVWEAVRSDLDSATKRATLAVFDSVLGLDLPDGRLKLRKCRKRFWIWCKRAPRRAVRSAGLMLTSADQVTELGFVIKDTPDGATVERL